MCSQSQSENVSAALLTPLHSDSPLYPQQTDEIKNILKLIQEKGGASSVKQNVDQSKFYRQLLANHFEELSEPSSVSSPRVNVIELVDAVPQEGGKLKTQKLDDTKQPRRNTIKTQLEEPNDYEDSLAMLNRELLKESADLEKETSLQIDLAKAAENGDTFRQSGQELFEKFCKISDEKERLSICKFISENITNQGLRNIISFLTDQFSWEEQIHLNMFLENVIFERLLTQDFVQESQGILPFILWVLAKNEILATKGFLLPLMKQPSSSEMEVLRFMTFVVRQLHEDGHKKAILIAYLCNHTQKLIEEVEVTFLEALVVEHEFDGFEDYIVLKDFTQHLLDSSLHGGTTTSINLNKNTKFGKLLLNVIKKMPTEIPSFVYEKLCQVVDVHGSFLKKAITVELKKKHVLT